MSNSVKEPSSGDIRTAEVLAAFSLATDLGTGRPMQHVIRACYIGMHVARQLRFNTQEQANLYYTLLLMHSGCTSDAHAYTAMIEGDELSAKGDTALRDMNNPLEAIKWMSRNVAPDAPSLIRLQRIFALLNQGPGGIIEGLKGVCEIGARVAQRLGMPEEVQIALRNMYEQWDGKGPYRNRPKDIPLLSRVVLAAFILEPYARVRGPLAAKQEARERKGKSLDPEVVQAFLALDKVPRFWEGLQKAELWEAVLDLEPDSPLCYIRQERLDDLILAFADLTDIKSPTDLGHSRGTARLAEAIARDMKLPQADISDIRRAALLHDLGNVGVPNTILDKQAPLTDAERARANLHPYYSEQVLGRVPVLGTIARLAGAHHERLDGQGYFRGLHGNEIPLGARILAVADEFQVRSQDRPDRPRLEPEQVLAMLKPEAGPHLDPDCFQALARQLGVSGSAPSTRRQWPAGLSDREVKVLRFLARGATNREIAQELVITPKTAEHHLEHIYNKLGVSSRAAAVFFAVENELVG